MPLAAGRALKSAERLLRGVGNSRDCRDLLACLLPVFVLSFGVNRAVQTTLVDESVVVRKFWRRISLTAVQVSV